jgi:hypothetical protein
LFLAALFAGPGTSELRAQSLPPGTTLPVQLIHSLSSDRVRPEKTFVVKTTQAVPLTSNRKVPKGTKIVGHIVAAQGPDARDGLSQLTLQFDKLVYRSGAETWITLGIRAMASITAVGEAQSPTNDPDMGPSNWNTVQIGGDIVYRGGGPVTTSWGETVGKPVSDGVVARLIAPREGTYPNKLHCTSDETLHALGLFASNACGVYGFSHLTIAKDGFTQPKGQIVLVSSSNSVKIASGSQFLLQVVEP